MVELVRASGAAAMVFLEMANVMDGLNKYRGTNRALGESLRISDGAVSRAVKKLIEWGYVVEERDRGSRVLVLNPDVVWGNASDQRVWVKYNKRRPRFARGLVAEGGDGLPDPQDDDSSEDGLSQEPIPA
jgi:hypothetical protein